ncbi:MAG: hypothetical protein HQ559_12570, partial [Lentisphaerae bacterium]|nr:hypothetical protein [Lentisphaerota bacterium]
MPEDTKTPDDARPPLPPKINLRKTGVLKVGVPGLEAGTVQPAAAVPPPSETQSSSGFSLTPKPAASAPVEPTPVPTPAPAAAQPAAPAEEKDQPPAASPKPLQARPATLSLERADTSKSETSKIPLEAARAMTDSESDGSVPQAVRIEPSVTAPVTIRAARPAGQPAAAAPASFPEKEPSAAESAKPPATARLARAATEDEKRKTSRISLESALGGAGKPETPAAPAASAPKTIRLKRPTEAPTVKAASPGSPVKAKTAEMDKVLRKTAQLDEEAAAAAAPSPTRKKTIRVKRPTQRPAVKGGGKSSAAPAPGMAVAPEEAAAPAAPAAPEVLPAAAPTDEPGIVFSLAAVAAILVTFLVIYVFSCQAFGPDSSLTKLSYALPELDLAWPGKITV